MKKNFFFEISRANYDLKYIGRYHFLLDSDLQLYSTVRLGQNLVFKAENAFLGETSQCLKSVEILS